MIILASDVSFLALLSIFWLRHKPWMLPVTEDLMTLLTEDDSPPWPGHGPAWLVTLCLPEIPPALSMLVLFFTFYPKQPLNKCCSSLCPTVQQPMPLVGLFPAGKMLWVLEACEGARVWFPGMVSSCSMPCCGRILCQPPISPLLSLAILILMTFYGTIPVFILFPIFLFSLPFERGAGEGAQLWNSPWTESPELCALPAEKTQPRAFLTHRRTSNSTECC